MDHADLQVKGILRGGDGDLLPVHEDLTFIRIVDAGEDVHQRGLAAAVFAQKGQDLAGIELQRYVIVGDDVAEALRNMAHFKNRDSVFQGDSPVT